MPGYEPYKHHSKYPFDNYYKINMFRWWGHFSMVSYIDPWLLIVNYKK